MGQNSGRNPNAKQIEKEPATGASDKIYKAFRSVEEDKISRSSVLMAKVFYMLDHKVWLNLSKVYV